MAIKMDDMRYYLKIPIVLFLLFSLVSEAQTEVTIRKKDFNTGKSGFEDAWKHVVEGNKYYKEGGIWYNIAFNEYLKAIVYNNSDPELNYKTGVSALFSDKKEEAAGFLLNALEFKRDVTEDVLLLTGRALQFSGRFADAVDKFNEYLNTGSRKPKEDVDMAKKCIDECNSAMIITKDTMRIRIENLGAAINSGSDEYSEIFSTDGKTMYFASRRETANSGKRHPDTKFDENIFVSHYNNGVWETTVPAGKEINTKYCEAPLFINKANDRLYIYAGYEKGGDIMVSENKNGIWKKPEKLPYSIDSKGSETSFCISPSGNEIYFVSGNRKDNIGGKDIYFIKKINERKWSKPVNAGSVINTRYDEEAVRFSKTGDTLWFSSKGHNSIGGFDIFYCVKNQNGEWDDVKNCGYPVNTVWDDMFYYPSPVGDSSFYFVSNRSSGLGGLDIWRGRILPAETVIVAPSPKRDTVVIRDTVVMVKELAPKPTPIYLEGKIQDSESGAPIMAKIDVIDMLTDSVVVTTASSDVDGIYRVGLPAKKPFNVNIRATGFLSDMKQAAIPENYAGETYTLNASLIKVKVGKKVVLNNILFETGKSILTRSSYVELDHLLGLMKENPNMKIEISGHTDITGSVAINLKLSGDRAKAVVEYLVQKGIDPSRLKSKGYGSSEPIANNATSQGRAKNRRVEFKILEF